jgi:hypothetical protein
MSKRIVFSFPDDGVSAEAELLEEAAPATCRLVWERLPIENRTLHGMYSGREVFVMVDPAQAVAAENLVNLPLPGEVLYFHQEGGVFVEADDAYAEVCVIYGRGVQLRGEGGAPTFANLFARLIGDWSAFAEICRRVRSEGPRRLHIERGEEGS